MTAPDLSALTDDELVAYVGGFYEATDPAVTPDPEYVASRRRLFVGLCELFGAGNTVGALEDVDADGCGGLLLDWPPIPPRPAPAWPVESCFDLGALGTAVDAAAKDGAK